MKTIIKLVIVAMVINAAYRAGDAAWRFYSLKDAAQQMLVFGADTPPERLQEQILKRAAELKVPVSPDNVTVTREGTRSAASVSYRQDIELFPSYRYPYGFSFNVDAVALR